MKGKNKHKKLKPIMKKSMLAALGLGIALPVAGSLPQANATAPESNVVIATPVLNDDIFWLNYSSDESNNLPIMFKTSLVALDNRVSIDLNGHFPTDNFEDIDATSNDDSVAEVSVYDNSKLIITPRKAGVIKITLQAKYSKTNEVVTDNIELYISKKGDLNLDGRVDSRDAAMILNYLNSDPAERTNSAVDLNRMDVNRVDGVDWADAHALLKGYVKGSLGRKDKNYVLTFKQVQDAPYVLNAQMTGTMQIGTTINSSYDALDVDGEGAATVPTSYQWYTSDDAAGTNPTLISGAESSSYTIQMSDAGKYLVLKIVHHSAATERPDSTPVIVVAKTPVDPPI